MRARAAAGAQQDAANTGASVWVAASAGTGKTKVLTDRVLALLLGGSAPQRILCLTFTKAAAAEMANRLNGTLSDWATMEEGELAQELQPLLHRMPDAELFAQARRLFALVLDTPGGMRIETIHAFCQSLLRRFPLEAGIAPHFDLMDERNAAEALRRARDEMLWQARSGENRALAEALAEITRYAAESTFTELMDALVRDRARLAEALAGGEMRFRELLARRLGLAATARPDAIVAAACGGGDFGLGEAVRLMEASTAQRDKARGAVLARWLAEPAQRAARFDDYLDVFFTQKGDERKDIMTSALAKSAPEAEAALRQEAARLAAIVRQRDAASLLCASVALAALGAAILKIYRRHKEERALLDYDDLVLAARDLLRRPGVAPWVLYKLDGGIDHILVDEAQDTNPEQWEVIAALAEEFFVGISAREGARTIFAVGDAKQSIYSFQRADPEAFRQTMRAHFARHAAEAQANWLAIDLTISYRSTPAVLAAVDAVFAQPEARSGVLGADEPPLRHEPSRSGAGGLVEIWPPVSPVAATPPSPWELPTEQLRQREPPARLAQAIADRIAAWIATGERLPPRDRAIRPGDILVLVRRRTSFVAELVRALKERAIAVAGADRMLLGEQLAVQDILALLQFLLLPEDDLTLATVLKGPLVGFDEERLYELAHDRGEASLWSELARRRAEHGAFARAADYLGGLLARADFAPPYELIAEVLGAGDGRRAMLERLGPDAGDPLDELVAAALDYERQHGPSLQGFLRWMSGDDTEVKRDLDQRGRDEVRIMTVHGAKGLQAPIVFLPDTMQVPKKLPRLLWSEEGLPLHKAHAHCGAPLHTAAQLAAEQRREEEYHRLLYVAMTRAEDRLYVCGWNTKQTAPSGCWYNLVAAGLAALPGAEKVRFDFGDADFIGEGWRFTNPQRGRVKSERLPPDLAIKGVLPDWARTPPKPEPSPPKPLAPSQPAGSEPAPRSPLGANEGGGFLRGRLVHRLLQSLPLLPQAARAASAQRFLALPVHGLTQAAQEALLAETMAVLEDPAFAPLFAPDAAAEVPVVGLIGERALSGRIDRLLVSDDAVLIVDYKTLRPVPASAAEIPAIYLAQLKAYRAAVAVIYPGRKISCALLWTDGPKLMPVSDALLTLP